MSLPMFTPVEFDYWDARGRRVTVRGQVRGATILGEPLYDVLPDGQTRPWLNVAGALLRRTGDAVVPEGHVGGDSA